MPAKTTSKRSLHRTNIPAPTGLLQTWPHSNPTERLSRLVPYATTCLKNWTTDTAALKENSSSMMPTKMHAWLGLYCTKATTSTQQSFVMRLASLLDLMADCWLGIPVTSLSWRLASTQLSFICLVQFQYLELLDSWRLLRHGMLAHSQHNS